MVPGKNLKVGRKKGNGLFCFILLAELAEPFFRLLRLKLLQGQGRLR
jgi:hypothetical protein